jgi:O-antigen/teichoic acid export membrane protein
MPSIEALSSIRALTHGVIWNGVGRILPIAAAMLATPFLLHQLGVERWALFTLALTIAGSFGILDFGISAALTRVLAERIGTPEEPEAPRLVVAALALILLIGCAGAAICFLIMPFVVDHLLNVPPDLRQEAIAAFRVVALSAPFIIINSAFWGVFAAYQKWRLAILVNVPANVLNYLGPVLALMVQDSLVAPVITLVGARLAQTVVAGALTLRLMPGLFNCHRVEFRILRPLLRIGAWVTVTNTMWPAVLFLDRFIVGAVLSLAAVSYFATPVDLVARLSVIPAAVAAAVFPAIATSYRTLPDRMQRILRTGSLIVIGITFPACLLMACLANELLTIWLGAAFAANSATALTILSVGMFLNSATTLPGTLTDAVGRPEAGAIIMLATTILFLPIVILMAEHDGVCGAAFAWTARSAVSFVARLIACGRLSRSAAPVVPRLFGITLAGTLAMIVCPLVQPMPFRLIAAGLAIITIFLMSGTMLLSPADRHQIRQWIMRYFLHGTLEQHQPAWNSRDDKVDSKNNEVDRADRFRSA